MTVDDHRPLADRMRPRRLQEFVGQNHLLGSGKPLRAAVESGHLHSMLLWGPPGCGKTTVARLFGEHSNAQLVNLSAVLVGVKEIRQVMVQAQTLWQAQQRRTVLFMDEVHRFNKAQQDAFLPFIENGTVIFVGATTENPSFALNDALLSRLRVYVFKPLDGKDILTVIQWALQDTERGLGHHGIHLTGEQTDWLLGAADGDVRRALNLLEIAVEAMRAGKVDMDSALQEVITGGVRRFDKRGDIFYDQISALHKSVRGSHPDAALYWYTRLVDGGCDLHYVARRVTRMASEDIGNADPRGLAIAIDAWQAYERLGSPEGELAIAQAIVYLACAAKSNAVYRGYQEALDDGRQAGSLEVPLHLRNAPTRLLKDLDHGKGYRYAHDETEGYASGEKYFPEALGERCYYRPVNRGLEIKIGEKLAYLRALDEKAEQQQR